MRWFVQQSLVLLVLAYVLGLACGWLLFRRRREHTTVDEATIGEPGETGWESAGYPADDDAQFVDAEYPADADGRFAEYAGAEYEDPEYAGAEYADPEYAGAEYADAGYSEYAEGADSRAEDADAAFTGERHAYVAADDDAGYEAVGYDAAGYDDAGYDRTGHDGTGDDLSAAVEYQDSASQASSGGATVDPVFDQVEDDPFPPARLPGRRPAAEQIVPARRGWLRSRRRPAELTADIAAVEAAPVEAVQTVPVEPVEAVQTVPVEAAPVEAVQTVPVGAVPVEVAQVEVAQVEVAQVEVAQVELTPAEAGQTVPADAVLVEFIPIKAAAIEAAPIEAAPIEASPIDAAARVQQAPAVTLPLVGLPLDELPIETRPAAAVPTYDDLTRIEGVQPAMADALVSAGLRTFRDVSRAGIDDLRAALRAAGLQPTFKVAYWPLAAGDLSQAAAASEHAADPEPAPEPEREPVASSHTVDRSLENEAPTPTVVTSADVVARVDAKGDGTHGADEPVTDDSVDVEPATDGLPTDPATDAPRTIDLADQPPAVVLPDARSGLGPSWPRVDNLERIDGISLKIATALRDVGIVTFDDLAAAPHGWLRSALSAAGLRFVPSLPTWGDQARLLAAGDEDGLANLKARLASGHQTGVRL